MHNILHIFAEGGSEGTLTGCRLGWAFRLMWFILFLMPTFYHIQQILVYILVFMDLGGIFNDQVILKIVFGSVEKE